MLALLFWTAVAAAVLATCLGVGLSLYHFEKNMEREGDS